jgi:hypothetical protein
MKKLFTFLLALVASVSTTFAHDATIGNIYYLLDSDYKTATVTYRGEYYDDYNKEYSGSVVIPSSVTYNGTTYRVTSIGKKAFAFCYPLTSITILDSVKSIGWNAFLDCVPLKEICIPNSVTSIGSHAFFGCESLTTITFQGTIAQWKEIALDENWKDKVPTKVVHCTDGDVEI